MGMWTALLAGVSLLMITRFWLDLPFQFTVFIPMFGSALAMYWVSLVTRSESDILLNRFYCTLHTPLEQEDRLQAVGIRLPAMGKQGKLGGPEPVEEIDETALADLYRAQSSYKIFGPNSSIEILREPRMGWYYRGFILILFACCALLGTAWLGGRVLASLSLAK
jgi:hypothetical protein